MNKKLVYILYSLLSNKMKTYDYQMSRSLFDLCPMPQSGLYFPTSSARPIKVKFHKKFLWVSGTKVYTNGPGHVTNMAAKPIYGKFLLHRNRKADDLQIW